MAATLTHVYKTPPELGSQQLVLKLGDCSAQLDSSLIPDNSKMIFSVWCCADSPNTEFQIIGSSTQHTISIGTNWERKSVEFEYTNQIILSVGSDDIVYFYKAQLESGDKTTDWKQAPEDTERQIYDSQKWVDNLYDNTRDMNSEDAWGWTLDYWVDTGELYNEQFHVLQRSIDDGTTEPGMYNGLSQLITVRANEEFTLSAYIKLEVGSSLLFYCENADKTGLSGGVIKEIVTSSPEDEVWTDWQRISFSFMALQDGVIQPRFENNKINHTLWICGIKLERGTTATDWNQSRGDIGLGIDSAAETANTAKSLAETIDAKLVQFQFLEDGFYIYPRREDDPSQIDYEGYYSRFGNASWSIQKGSEQHPSVLFRPKTWIQGNMFYFVTARDGGVAHRIATEDDYV